MLKLLLGKGAKVKDATLCYPLTRVNFQIIKYLLKRGANPKATDYFGKSVLHKECEKGNFKNIKYLIQHYNADVFAKNDEGQTPLHLACNGNDMQRGYIFENQQCLKMVKHLIEEQNADPEVTCNEGKSAMHYAAENHYGSSILRYLTEDQKLDIKATDNEGRTALHIACQTDIFVDDKWSTQKYLIEDHAKIIEAKDKKGKTALYYCLENFGKLVLENYFFDKFKPIALILATKANILKKQENKDTDHIFDWIKQSYDNDMKKSKGKDEAVSCLYSGLQKFQKQVDKKDETNIEFNPLLLLVDYCNRVDIAKFMFNQDLCYIKAHFNAEEVKSKRILLLKSYLEFSCENNLLDLTSFLFQEIKKKLESFEQLSFDGSFLKTACKFYSTEVFKYLLEDEKAKDEAAEFLKDCPLHFACGRGSLEMVQYLIETKKIDIEVKDKKGRTPLHLTCKRWSIDIAKYLIEKQNANINTTNNKGRSVLHSACQSRCFKLVRYISQKTKLDVNAQDEDGSTALHLACEHRRKFKGHYITSNLKLVKFLITDMKADLHLVDKKGRTPLHVQTKVSILKYLVSQGANVLTKDRCGKSPLQNAPAYKTELIAFLKAATKR
jgi:ankyrin repeat protein